MNHKIQLKVGNGFLATNRCLIILKCFGGWRSCVWLIEWEKRRLWSCYRFLGFNENEKHLLVEVFSFKQHSFHFLFRNCSGG
jgi:hypothetical protein